MNARWLTAHSLSIFHAAGPSLLETYPVQGLKKMSVDLVLRAIATLTCMYTAGLFITLSTIAALNAAGADPMCGPGGCMATYEQRVPPIRGVAVPIRTAAVITPRRA